MKSSKLLIGALVLLLSSFSFAGNCFSDGYSWKMSASFVSNQTIANQNVVLIDFNQTNASSTFWTSVDEDLNELKFKNSSTDSDLNFYKVAASKSKQLGLFYVQLDANINNGLTVCFDKDGSTDLSSTSFLKVFDSFENSFTASYTDTNYAGFVRYFDSATKKVGSYSLAQYSSTKDYNQQGDVPKSKTIAAWYYINGYTVSVPGGSLLDIWKNYNSPGYNYNAGIFGAGHNLTLYTDGASPDVNVLTNYDINKWYYFILNIDSNNNKISAIVYDENVKKINQTPYINLIAGGEDSVNYIRFGNDDINWVRIDSLTLTNAVDVNSSFSAPTQSATFNVSIIVPTTGTKNNINYDLNYIVTSSSCSTVDTNAYLTNSTAGYYQVYDGSDSNAVLRSINSNYFSKEGSQTLTVYSQCNGNPDLNSYSTVSITGDFFDANYSKIGVTDYNGTNYVKTLQYSINYRCNNYSYIQLFKNGVIDENISANCDNNSRTYDLNYTPSDGNYLIDLNFTTPYNVDSFALDSNRYVFDNSTPTIIIADFNYINPVTDFNIANFYLKCDDDWSTKLTYRIYQNDVNIRTTLQDRNDLTIDSNKPWLSGLNVAQFSCIDILGNRVDLNESLTLYTQKITVKVPKKESDASIIIDAFNVYLRGPIANEDKNNVTVDQNFYLNSSSDETVTFRITSTNYFPRSYIVDLNGSDQIIQPYLLDNNNGFQFTVSIFDNIFNNPLEGAKLELYKYFGSVLTLVESASTDGSGRTTMSGDSTTIYVFKTYYGGLLKNSVNFQPNSTSYYGSISATDENLDLGSNTISITFNPTSRLTIDPIDGNIHLSQIVTDRNLSLTNVNVKITVNGVLLFDQNYAGGSTTIMASQEFTTTQIPEKASVQVTVSYTDKWGRTFHSFNNLYIRISSTYFIVGIDDNSYNQSINYQVIQELGEVLALFLAILVLFFINFLIMSSGISLNLEPFIFINFLVAGILTYFGFIPVMYYTIAVVFGLGAWWWGSRQFG